MDATRLGSMAPQEFDLVVYGSTSAAVAASIQAARLGRSVALVSPHEHIGMNKNLITNSELKSDLLLV